MLSAEFTLGSPMQLATMPLDRVPVVSLDLETTGLRARAFPVGPSRT